MDDMTGNPPRTDQPHVGGQDASDERIGSAADSDWAVAQLAVLRGEAKGLLAANEMAEKACTVLREELRLSRLDRTWSGRWAMPTHGRRRPSVARPTCRRT
jgi:hypothetical protein